MNSIIRRGTAVALTVAACALIAGCDDSYLDQSSARSQQPISSSTLAEMEKLDTTPSSPTVIRTYKKEAELEIWKMKSNGEYALLKTYPMCRWSGQLGPKKREGDMQVPEGFYSIAPGQMNPNSHYYLAFNVGYPNSYDRAYGRTGGNVMVHGVCSSAGCFSMTDDQVADIYAIARDSFRGGQREIQLQSYPFHMTAENMAKFRLDPNIDFWKNLKDGSDHFEVTKNEPSVLVCGKHYVFDATTKDEVIGSEPCPALKRDETVEALVAEKEHKDESRVAELAASGVKPIHLVYADGGQNPVFTGYKDVSDPEALASGPQEIVLSDRKIDSGRGEGRRSRRGEKADCGRGVSASRRDSRAVGSDDGRRNSGSREPVWRDARGHRRRQERPEMAASWWTGACASSRCGRRARPQPANASRRVAPAPRRRAFGLAAYGRRRRQAVETQPKLRLTRPIRRNKGSGG